MAEYENRGTYLFVQVAPRYSPGKIEAYLTEIKSRCESENMDRVCIDLTNTAENLDTMDRYEIGKAMAEIFGTKIRIATVNKPQNVTYLAENTAVNRGGTMKVFTDLQAAVTWLEQP